MVEALSHPSICSTQQNSKKIDQKKKKSLEKLWAASYKLAPPTNTSFYQWPKLKYDKTLGMITREDMWNRYSWGKAR